MMQGKEVVSLQGRSPADRGPALRCCPTLGLCRTRGNGPSLHPLTNGKAFPWVIKHLCMGLETVAVSPQCNYGYTQGRPSENSQALGWKKPHPPPEPTGNEGDGTGQSEPSALYQSSSANQPWAFLACQNHAGWGLGCAKTRTVRAP